MKWKINDDVNLFATYAKGNKPGGVNGATAALNGYPNDVFFQPETSKNYELGLKSRWFNNRFVFNATLYKIKNEGMQLTTPIQNAMGAVASIVTNQGSGEVKGVEIETQWKATDHLTLGATYALADTKFTKGCDDFQWQLTSGGGIYLTNFPSFSTNLTGRGNCSIVGNPYPLAAKNTASLTADFKRPIRDGRMSLYVNADVSFTDKKAVQVHANPFTPAATLVGLRFGVEGDNWNAGVYARNLTNEDSSPSATRWFEGWLIGSSGVPSTLDPGFIPTTKTITVPNPDPVARATINKLQR